LIACTTGVDATTEEEVEAFEPDGLYALCLVRVWLSELGDLEVVGVGTFITVPELMVDTVVEDGVRLTRGEDVLEVGALDSTRSSHALTEDCAGLDGLLEPELELEIEVDVEAVDQLEEDGDELSPELPEELA
jgi:hypothetical protein